MDVLHTAIWVTDLETQAAFYEDVLDLEYSREFDLDGVTNYFMTGESDAEVQFKYDADADVDPDPGTVDHLAFATDDVDGTVETAVEEWGSDIVNGPLNLDHADARIAFVTDPEGYTVELIEAL
jgi:lactoylglutathione lyase